MCVTNNMFLNFKENASIVEMNATLCLYSKK